MLDIEPPLLNESDVEVAIGAVQHAAAKRGLPDLHGGLLACAVSEVSTNAVRYGEAGRIVIRTTPNGRGVEVEVDDRGPGIDDIDRVFQDGYTTSSDSLGLGLGAAKRAVEYLHLDTTPGHGTRIVMRTYPPIPSGWWDLGLVTLPSAGQIENGDQLAIHEIEGERLLAAVIDGRGETKQAHRAALVASRAIAANYTLPLEQLMEAVHRAVQGHAGSTPCVAVGIASLGRDRIDYVESGPVDVRLLGPSGVEVPRSPASGQRAETSARSAWSIQSYRISDGVHPTTLLCSSGIDTRFVGQPLPLDGPAQGIADRVMDHHRLPHGDSTVLVIKA